MLGLHLGMSGRILVTDPAGGSTEGGDRLTGSGRGAAEQADRRPDGPASRSPSTTAAPCACSTSAGSAGSASTPTSPCSGPTPPRISAAAFRERVGRGTAAVKARLLDQSVLAGVGNLLADETLWQARIDPRRRVDALSADDLAALHRALRAATRAAIRQGGVHTGTVIAHRAPRRPLPAVRRRDAAGHRRRPDHLVLPSRTALTRPRHGACARRPVPPRASPHARRPADLP